MCVRTGAKISLFKNEVEILFLLNLKAKCNEYFSLRPCKLIPSKAVKRNATTVKVMALRKRNHFAACLILLMKYAVGQRFI